MSSADFKRDGKDIWINVPDGRFIVVPDFPAESGWYLPFGKTTVPHGNTIEISDCGCSCFLDPGEARHLWRARDSSYVGLLTRRAPTTGGMEPHIVYADDLASDDFGPIVEVSEKDAAVLNKV